ncbi:MAG TPA: alpha/beta hydrolase [Bacteroidia bacterium]|jgi:pimeloyl-ACP methyl ester carboxylesterase|nr:alpha/beta hydrolase [Bacteroidia bacterium]
MAKVISKDGTPIGFDKIGKGEPLIMVDGAMCSRAFGPIPKMGKMLADHFTVINYDRRGRNESGNTLPYSVEREVEDIDALIKEAGGSAHLVGFSSGAALVLNAAAKGLNIKKTVLYEAPYVMNQGGHNPPKDTEAQLKQLVASGRMGDAVKFFMKDMVGMPAFFPAIMSLLPVWSKLKSVAHTLPYDAAILGDFTIPVVMAATVITPALVVGGEKSPIGLRNAVIKLAEAMPNAKQKLLKGQNHNVSAKAIVPVLVEYFKT